MSCSKGSPRTELRKEDEGISRPGVGAPDIAARVCHGFLSGFELDASIDGGWLAAAKKPAEGSDDSVGALGLGGVDVGERRNGDDSGSGESDGDMTGGTGERA